MTDPDDVAAALHALHPPVDPNDIATWPADQLDELGVWQAAVDGLEVTTDPDTSMLRDPANEHGKNLDHEMTWTAPDGVVEF